MNLGRWIRLAIGFALVLGGGGFVIAWTFFRVHVGPDECLVLIRKFGAEMPPGQIIAGAGQKGVQAEALGPGWYFVLPWMYDVETHKLIEISAGTPPWPEMYKEAASDLAIPEIKGDVPEIGILVNKIGKEWTGTEPVVEEGYKGVQKRVLTPGTYRLNPYIYEVRREQATMIPMGCVGVVTAQIGESPGTEEVLEATDPSDLATSKPAAPKQPVQKMRMAGPGQRGVLNDVLQPGIYYMNPYMYKIHIVQVGYNQITQQKGKDVSTQITFPSKDGFTVNVDVTVVWGRHPQHTAEMINRFGDIESVRDLILRYIRSICRNTGSEYVSTDFISGEKREQYQRKVTEILQDVCRQRDIDILIALVQNIEVHGSPEAEKDGMDLKKTIQAGYIAREQELTKQVQRETAKVRAQLETAKVSVDISRTTVSAETKKRVAEITAEGEKKAQETLARRDLDVSQIDRQAAELGAEQTRVTGRAKTQVEQLKNQAQADGKRMFVEAFGSGRAYNLYTFAQNFAPDSIRLIFAGPGTFWTDLTKLQDAASMELLKQTSEKTPAH